MSKQQQNGSVIAIVTMFFLYAMISFVTNLGAPIGVIWKNQPEIGGSNVLRTSRVLTATTCSA